MRSVLGGIQLEHQKRQLLRPGEEPFLGMPCDKDPTMVGKIYEEPYTGLSGLVFALAAVRYHRGYIGAT